MSKRVVSQKAFEDLVRENMEEFEMDVEEAIEDAQKQFEAQDADLSHVIADLARLHVTSTGDNDSPHPVAAAVASLSSALAADPPDDAAVAAALRDLRSLAAVDLAHRVLAGQSGAAAPTFAAFGRAVAGRRAELFDAAVAALGALLDGNPDLATEEQLAAMVAPLRPSQDEWLTGQQVARLLDVLQMACVKHEANRQTLVRMEVVPVAVACLGSEEAEAAAEPDREVVRAVCGLLQALTLDDDVRVPFGKAHDHAKAIVTETPALKVLLRLCRAFKESEDNQVVADAFATLSKLSVRNEFCQTLLDCGGVALILESLSNHVSDQAIVRTSLMLLKSLAGNDNVKAEVGRCGGLPVVLEAMQRLVANPAVAAHGSAAVAAVCLRQPDNSQRAVDAGAPALLEQVLKVHINNASVYRAVCHAVRNIVSRRPDLRPAFLAELSFEQLLNDVGLQVCPDEAKAALRDLGCKVALRELWTGERGQIVKDCA